MLHLHTQSIIIIDIVIILSVFFWWRYMSTLFSTTASAVSATVDIITVSKFSINPQPQPIPIFWVLGSLVLVLLMLLASGLLLLSQCTFPFANLFPFRYSDRLFCLFLNSHFSEMIHTRIFRNAHALSITFFATKI